MAPEILEKVQRGETLSEREAEDYASHPLLGADLIGRIPRLGRVAKIIMYQNKSFDGTGFPIDDVKKEQIPLEARILHVCCCTTSCSRRVGPTRRSIDSLKKSHGKVDPIALDALKKSCDVKGTEEMVRVLPSEMMLGMVVHEDVKTDQGSC